MARTFFALWPDEDAAVALARLSRTLAGECGGKPVAREKIHLTLAFLGAIDAAALERARGIGSRLRFEPFDLVLDRVGSFRPARVAWAGFTQVPEPLREVAEGLAVLLCGAGIELEDRRFVPHVTLARRIRGAVASAPVEPVQWRVRGLALVESEGGRYVNIETWETR